MKKRLVCLMMVCMMMLSACGEKEETATKDIAIEESSVRYNLDEMSVPDPLLSENALGSDYIGNDFRGFVSDLQGKPAAYYCNASMESEEYYATLTRWRLDEDGNWVSDELCENAIADFLNQKFEQTSWLTYRLGNFRRGDSGSLYGVFTYYVRESQQTDEGAVENIRENYSFLEIDEENDSLFEIPLEIGPDAMDEREYSQQTDSTWISDYHAFEDGSIMLLTADSGGGFGYLIDSETGQVSKELGNVVTGKRRFAFGESELIFYSNNISRFQVLSIPDMEEQNTIGEQLSPDVLGKDWYYYVNPDTWELFLCNGSGVYKALNYQSSDEVECLTLNTDMSETQQGDSQILDFFMGADEDFYICLMQTTEEYGEQTRDYRILHYTIEEK